MKTLGSGWWALIFLFAAVFEVFGDAVIQSGYKEKRIWLGVIGFLVLGTYGVILNLVNKSESTWTLSKMLGIYVVFFASVSVARDSLLDYFKPESVPRAPLTSWLGLLV